MRLLKVCAHEGARGCSCSHPAAAPASRGPVCSRRAAPTAPPVRRTAYSRSQSRGRKFARSCGRSSGRRRPAAHSGCCPAARRRRCRSHHGAAGPPPLGRPPEPMSQRPTAASRRSVPPGSAPAPRFAAPPATPPPCKARRPFSISFVLSREQAVSSMLARVLCKLLRTPNDGVPASGASSFCSATCQDYDSQGPQSKLLRGRNIMIQATTNMCHHSTDLVRSIAWTWLNSASRSATPFVPQMCCPSLRSTAHKVYIPQKTLKRGKIG